MPEEDVLPRVLSGRYRLEATLGHGGMGVVYRGSDLTMKRPIAVKLVRAADGVELDDEIAGRFLREAKNTARLQHEHIIELFDLGRAEDGSLYFVMELLEGESLSARLRRDGKLSPEAATHIGRQICEALHVAHTAGVIHRDLKPANIMLLSRAGYDDYVKVLDFGVAKSLSSDQDTQLTHTGMLVGTVDYMAPEQITGKPVDGRTDIYAFGVLLYKMLSGHAPFRDTGVPALIHAHLNRMPKPLTEVTTDVPNALDHVVLRCLAKDPDRRYESMAEVARALTAAVMPGGMRMIEFEYGGISEADPYSDGEQTKVGRSFDDVRPPPEEVTVSKGGDVFDDATIKIDRPLALRGLTAAPAGSFPVTPGGARMLRTEAAEFQGGSTPPTAPVQRDNLSTAYPPAPAGVRSFAHSGPKTCAMCQTPNASYARVCAACGVSLSLEEQAAVRARVRSDAPSAVSDPGPGIPPGPSGPFPMAGNVGAVPSHPSHAHGPSPHGPSPSPPLQAEPVMQWLPHQPPPAPALPPPSMWQRFLAWTGLRGK